MSLFGRKKASPIWHAEVVWDVPPVRERAYAPHCDQRVLHAPGECVYCDSYDDWQRLRVMWGINFTGHNDEGKLLCPSALLRPLETIYKWPGNQPRSMVEILDDSDF